MHQTFITTYISMHCVKVLHVWPPSICQQPLLLLDLQLLRQLKQDAGNHLVACQLVLKTDSDSAEDLIMNVSIQSPPQLRSRQAGMHLQECLCNLAFQSEERLPVPLHSQSLRFIFYQTERYRHLEKRKN